MQNLCESLQDAVPSAREAKASRASLRASSVVSFLVFIPGACWGFSQEKRVLLPPPNAEGGCVLGEQPGMLVTPLPEAKRLKLWPCVTSPSLLGSAPLRQDPLKVTGELWDRTWGCLSRLGLLMAVVLPGFHPSTPCQ